MKVIGKFLEHKKLKRKQDIDSESVFYILKNIIKVKYGEIGALNIKLDYYKAGVVFLKINNSNWANEIWLNKQMIIDEINKKLGEDEIKDLKLK
ncbi:MAG: hypothetical protein ACD_7C00086G0020 [uncultured bacterium]|nr:MAG: hypothetical protein ACD_7C00086G0020 [uncultured bacterium]KKP69130.1 MAG: hypothetical protein UR66_C0001G0012 [Candidatus Moranbacteria bacterium GW2011_GWE1_35_17]KKP83121.1 MAG: hypothetical protein UR83_C0039G0015 [Candidatus Moranbacteria bacterium GW2011_GWF2_35_54]KKP83554.1 MAG: hypothetical protein UR82_C0020G0018 [Candidatus Moranbacteria bacterium GW2011_GWF1_35_5]HBR79770.1 hypothetical protein [Candidatus Moranbacteria bacterium]